MELHIKYMVCLCCKIAVSKELKKLNLRHSELELGRVKILGNITEAQRSQLKENLAKIGLELLDEKDSRLVEKTKSLIIDMFHYAEELPKVSLTDKISEILACDAAYLSKIFSEINGMSIEHYIAIQRTESAKICLLYEELSLSEISRKLHYSSIANLSKEFENITGLKPAYFKILKEERKRLIFENVGNM